MPEMPELEVVRRRLSPLMQGRAITDVTVPPRQSFLLRAPVADLLALRGRVVERISRRGKFLVLDIDSAHLVINPMLGGRFQWAAAGEKVGANTVLRLHLDEGDELRFTDSVRMGRLYLAEAGRMDAVPGFAELGPEAAEVGLEEFLQRIRRHPGEIKNLLRNQAFVAGIGNAYSDEVLHHARVLPLRRRSSLSADELTQLHASMHHVLSAAVAAIEAQPGYRMHEQDRSFMAVHGKGGQACPRCGHRISELTARGEITNFCRGCQK